MPIKQAAPRQHHFMQITSQQIEEIRAGKIKTFEILFNAYYPRVKSFAFGMIKDQYEAEEIAQNVFLKLWSNREKLSSDNTLSSYIFTIVQNEVYDFFREKHSDTKKKCCLLHKIYSTKSIRNITSKK